MPRPLMIRDDLYLELTKTKVDYNLKSYSDAIEKSIEKGHLLEEELKRKDEELKRKDDEIRRKDEELKRDQNIVKMAEHILESEHSKTN